MNRGCFVCKRNVKGLGHYTYRYLDDTKDLCGHCAQKLMTKLYQLEEEENQEGDL